MNYKLAGIKMAGGEETPRFEANIMENGKKIGIVYNEGMGGCCGYTFMKERNILTTPPAFADFINAWGVAHKEDTEVMDTWVYVQLDEYENNKRFKRVAKTKTLFRVKGTSKEEWRVIKAPYSEGVHKFLVKKFGNELTEIYGHSI